MEKKYSQRDLEMIQEILCRLLGRMSVNMDEDIYVAGLTSIMALPFLVEVEDAFKLAIPDAGFLAVRTPRDLAEMVQHLRGKSVR